MTSRYLALSFLSGCVWAVIGYCIGHQWMSPFIWGGLLASPFIGLAVGALYHRACKRSPTTRILLSLVTLYLAATLFGLAAGIHDALRYMPPGVHRSTPAVVLQAILGTWWGVTFTGYVLVLWPLSFINHSLVCRFGGASQSACCST